MIHSTTCFLSIIFIILISSVFGSTTAVNNVQVVATTAFSTRGSGIPIVFTFTRSDTTTAQTLAFSASGTAVSADISTTTFTVGGAGSVSFAVGASSATISGLPQSTGSTNASPVTIIITITPAGGITDIGTPATGVILDNTNVVNTMVVGVSPASTNINAATPLLTFSVYRSGIATLPYQVAVTLTGTAVIGNDYTVASPYLISLLGNVITVEIPAGLTSVTILATPKYSSSLTGSVSVIATLNTPPAPAPYVVNVIGSATGTIVYDNPFIRLLAPIPASVSESSGSALIFTVSRTGSTAATQSVPFSVTGSLTEFSVFADPGVVYTAATGSGTITIPIGTSAAQIRLFPINDAVLTSATKVIVMSIAPVGVSFDPTTQQGTIIDDEANTFTITSFQPASIFENDMSSIFTVQVSRSAGTATLAVTASVALTVGGTAVLTGDYTVTGTAVVYTATSATVTFAAGQTVAAFTIAPVYSALIAPDKTITLSITPGNYLTTGTTSATVTINNADGNNINVVVSPINGVNIGDSIPLVFIFTRRVTNTAAFTASFTVGGTAVFGTQYTQVGATTFTATTGSITFADGSLQAALQLTPLLSTTPGQDLTIVISLISNAGYAAQSPSSATGTIINNVPSSVGVTLSPGFTPDDGTTGMSFTFTRNGRLVNPLVVSISLAGTASFTAPDYSTYSTSALTLGTGGTGTITIAAGSSSATLIVTPVLGTAVAGDKTVLVTVAASASYTPAAGSTSATGVIFSRAGPNFVSVLASPITQPEASTTPFVVQFRRSGSPTATLTVSFSVALTSTVLTDFTVSGAASFTATAGTVLIPAGAYSATISIQPRNNDVPEPDKIILLTVLSDTVGMTYSASTTSPVAVTLTISNDDPQVSLAIIGLSSLSQSIGGTFVYQFFRPLGAINGALTIQYKLGGTAVPSVDYNVVGMNTGFPSALGNTGSIIIPDQQQTATIQLAPVDFKGPQPDKTISLTLAAPAMSGAYFIATPAAVVATITNPYPTQVSLSLAPTTITEGSTTPGVFTVTRLGSTSTDLTVSFSVSGTAAFGTRYTLAGTASFNSVTLGGTVVIRAGSSTATITVNVVDDQIVQPDQTVIVTLGTGTGYTLNGLSTATLTIKDNDGITVTLAVSPMTAVYSPNSLSFTFSRTGGLGTDVTVSFTLAGSATLNQHYTLSGPYSGAGPFSLLLASGTSSVVLTVTPIQSAVLSFTRSVIMTLNSGTTYQLGSPSTATGLISDPPIVPPAVSVTTNVVTLLDSVASGVAFTFRVPQTLTADLIVNFKATGNATLNLDYSVTNSQAKVVWNPDKNGVLISTVIISAGSSVTTVTIVALPPISQPIVTITATVIPPTTTGLYTVGTPSTQTVSLLRDPSAVITNGAGTFTGNIYSIRVINVGLSAEPDDGPNVSGRRLREVHFAAVSSATLITSAATFLGISTQYIRITENFGNQIIMQFSTIPNGASNSVLGANFVLAINSRVPQLATTPYAYATGYTIGTFPDVTNIVRAPPAIIIPAINQYFVVYVADNRPMRLGSASALQISVGFNILLVTLFALITMLLF